MKFLARVGFVARGVMYVVIGWIALQVAFGKSRQQADRTGALHELSSTPFGSFALWLLVIGFFGMALWRLSEAMYGSAGSGGRKTSTRVAALARVVLYAAVGYGVLKYALRTGGPQSSNQQFVLVRGDHPSGVGRSGPGRRGLWPPAPDLVGLCATAPVPRRRHRVDMGLVPEMSYRAQVATSAINHQRPHAGTPDVGGTR